MKYRLEQLPMRTTSIYQYQYQIMIVCINLFNTCKSNNNSKSFDSNSDFSQNMNYRYLIYLGGSELVIGIIDYLLEKDYYMK